MGRFRREGRQRHGVDAGNQFSMPEQDVVLYGYFKKPVDSVEINGGDFFAQGPNSTLEVDEGSVPVIRVQDMWIDDEFDFYVNGTRVKTDAANTITVVVDGYMLIGALSMDVEVPDVVESINLLTQIINFFKQIIEWFKNLFK